MMTDTEVRQQIARADRFIGQLRDTIAATAVDPASLCADAQRRGLQRIAATLDAVPFETMCNLANLDAAMRGGLLDVIEAHLLAVGGGPTLDYADAAAFLAGYETVIEKLRRRRLQ
jgi:glycerol dehydrogenase-like iron-containing ADH family enzyme